MDVEKEGKNKIDGICKVSWRPSVEMHTGIITFRNLGEEKTENRYFKVENSIPSSKRKINIDVGVYSFCNKQRLYSVV
jgi:hypothetical protein